MKKVMAIVLRFASLAVAALVILLLNEVSKGGSHAPLPADMEIMALSAAIEDYKTDHGHYPTDHQTTERLDSNGPYHPAAHEAASAFLYRVLSGVDEKDKKNYLANIGSKYFFTDRNGVTRIVDPWGNPLGYSTMKAARPNGTGGNNPTFDLWSTGTDETRSKQTLWVKNW